MNVATYRPKYPRLANPPKPAFDSRAIGRKVTVSTVSELPAGDLSVVETELTEAIASFDLQIASAGPDGKGLALRRKALAAIRQVVQARLGVLRREQRSRYQGAELKALEIAHHFVQVAKQELDPTTYQRLILQAEIRHKKATRQ